MRTAASGTRTGHSERSVRGLTPGDPVDPEVWDRPGHLAEEVHDGSYIEEDDFQRFLLEPHELQPDRFRVGHRALG
jgi:hypothetical protein